MAKFYTAVVTVFHEDGSLDFEGNKAIYEHLINAGSDGIVLMGSTGEFCSLTMEMAKELTDLALDTIKGRMDVIVGTSRKMCIRDRTSSFSLSHLLVLYNIFLNGICNTIFFICFCHIICDFLYMFQGISHGNSESHRLDHLNIIFTVTNSHHLFHGNL